MADTTSQWPCTKRLPTLTATWSKILPGADIAELCEHGLHPVTTKGFCVMHCKGRPTPLTATLADNPGTILIVPHRLASIVACILIKSIGPEGCISFAKRKLAELPQSALWALVGAALAPVTSLAAPLSAASHVKNPYQREFVLASAYRLQQRCGPTELCTFVDIALKHPWKTPSSKCTWIAPLTRFIRTRDIEWAVCTKPEQAFIIIGTCPITIAYKDRVLLLLVALFCNPTAWAENPPAKTALPEPVKNAFEAIPSILHPAPCPIHSAIAQCMMPRH